MERSKSNFASKIHTLVDGLGNLLKFILTPGQSNDVTQAETLTSDIKKRIVIPEKGYDVSKLVENLKANDYALVIPAKKNRKKPRLYDQHI